LVDVFCPILQEGNIIFKNQDLIAKGGQKESFPIFKFIGAFVYDEIFSESKLDLDALLANRELKLVQDEKLFYFD